ncbi:hypothetical protein KPP03845_200009 (plasmid) [Streptomyces xanthophaeus]|uniref:hypothetical protein n=1 Tax=Streptomyces xanthophaeus TaxID=67385 RepID=UPI00233F21F7|nr:hypothetical protein [Streptomyces xanthophaeus]WCD91048.1 hypothetical protein KPP03845_200009 [Streptomyces xanthophaeus]
MIERRILGTGPHPTTPAAQPTAGRRARLAAEPAEPIETPANAPHPRGRRQLGTGPDAAAH